MEPEIINQQRSETLHNHQQTAHHREGLPTPCCVIYLFTWLGAPTHLAPPGSFSMTQPTEHMGTAQNGVVVSDEENIKVIFHLFRLPTIAFYVPTSDFRLST